MEAINYKHIKTGKIYTAIFEGIDTTNIRNGIKIVVYKQEGNPQIFVREKEEFLSKFRPIGILDV